MCSLPPYSLSKKVIQEIESQAKKIAKELNVVGLMNIQFAVQDEDVFIIEVNPRASRTVPFISKCIENHWLSLRQKPWLVKH